MTEQTVRRCPGTDRSASLKLAGFLGAFLLPGLASMLSAADRQPPDYSRDIRPLLSRRCAACHGPDEQHREAELRVDNAESLTRDRDGYSVVRPFRPDESELLTRVASDDPDLRMPPAEAGEPLSAEEQELLRNWIAAGAEIRPHWAYLPPSAVPPSSESGNLTTTIDRLVSERLKAEGLKHSPAADRITLLRRVCFDVTGLPPDGSVAEAYLTDSSPDAYETLLNELLESDAHAERLTTYWLDLVRYADTVGYHGDQDHNISPYRDWVIDAFAGNMSFDEFTRLQLAGDLVPDAGVDGQIASGYNRLLQTSHEGGVQPKEYLAIYSADRVRNVSAVWMGATIGCAQCHDHKYDPFTQKDFYSLAAFFADIDEAGHFRDGTNALPTKRPPEIRVHTRRERERLTELRKLQTALETRVAEEPDNASLAEQLRQIGFDIEDLEAASRFTMITAALPTPRETRILPRGNWLDESGPVVEPAVPESLGSLSAGDSRADRLQLAAWLTDCDEGVGLLTARVFVNRLWYLCFGRGLAANLDDFGGQGNPPDHPELLDALAVDFASDWNIRRVLRSILMSRTYRQSSAWTDELLSRDPVNVLLARQSSWRLHAEMIRDNALSVSGLLNRTVGGASVKPYQPAGYYRHLNFPTRRYRHHDDPRQYRRGLYVHWQRQFLHPMMRAFDAPTREECTAQRPQSNTPLAALVLLNDPSFVEASRGLAIRILSRPSDDDEGRIRFGFQTVVSREPDKSEIRELNQLLEAARHEYAEDPKAAQESLKVGMAPLPEGTEVVETAAWTLVSRALLNLDETVTRY